MKIGDKVRLKSGGPVMTVSVVYLESVHNRELKDYVGTIWFEASDKGWVLRNNDFPILTLEVIE